MKRHTHSRSIKRLWSCPLCAQRASKRAARAAMVEIQRQRRQWVAGNLKFPFTRLALRDRMTEAALVEKQLARRQITRAFWTPELCAIVAMPAARLIMAEVNKSLDRNRVYLKHVFDAAVLDAPRSGPPVHVGLDLAAPGADRTEMVLYGGARRAGRTTGAGKRYGDSPLAAIAPIIRSYKLTMAAAHGIASASAATEEAAAEMRASGLSKLDADDLIPEALPDIYAHNQGKPARVSTQFKGFTAFRKDGWPLCPQCGEDELYSLAEPASAEKIDGCYRCQWKPGKPVVKKVCDLCCSSGECTGACE